VRALARKASATGWTTFAFRLLDHFDFSEPILPHRYV